jgi:glutathione S-transferase
VSAYFDRLCARESFVRTIREAQPYFRLFPFQDHIPARFLERDARSFARAAPDRR